MDASESIVSRILGHKAIAGTIAVSGIYYRFGPLCVGDRFTRRLEIVP